LSPRWANPLYALWSLEVAIAKHAFTRNRTLGILGGSLLALSVVVAIMSFSSASSRIPRIPARSFTFALTSLWLAFVAWYSLFGGKASLRPSEHTLFELGGLRGRAMFGGLMIRVCREAATVCLPLALLVGFSTRYFASVFAFLTAGIALAIIQSASAVTAKSAERAGWRFVLAIVAFSASIASGIAVWRFRDLPDEVALSVAFFVPTTLLAATLVSLVFLILGNDQRWIGPSGSMRPRRSIPSHSRFLVAFPAPLATAWLPGAVLARSTQRKAGLVLAVACSAFVGTALRGADIFVAFVAVIAIFSSLAAFLQSYAASLIRYPTWCIAAKPSSWTVLGTIVGTAIPYYVCTVAALLAAANDHVLVSDVCLAIVLGLLSVTAALQMRFITTWYFRRFETGFDIVDVIFGALSGTIAILPTLLVWSIGGLYSTIGVQLLMLVVAGRIAPSVIRRRGIPLIV